MGVGEGDAEGPGTNGASQVDITGLLQLVEDGDEAAFNSLFARIYVELHSRAVGLMHHQPEGHTLQPTALVNEAFLKLRGPRAGPWKDRQHFVLAAGRAMRSILCDHARRKKADKRGGGKRPTAIDEVLISYEDLSIDLLALQEALVKLEDVDPSMARAVEMMFFGGATVAEAARVVDIPIRTFTRRLKMTRAWLFKQVQG